MNNEQPENEQPEEERHAHHYITERLADLSAAQLALLTATLGALALHRCDRCGATVTTSPATEVHRRDRQAAGDTVEIVCFPCARSLTPDVFSGSAPVPGAEAEWQRLASAMRLRGRRN